MLALFIRLENELLGLFLRVNQFLQKIHARVNDYSKANGNLKGD